MFVWRRNEFHFYESGCSSLKTGLELSYDCMHLQFFSSSCEPYWIGIFVEDFDSRSYTNPHDNPIDVLFELRVLVSNLLFEAKSSGDSINELRYLEYLKAMMIFDAFK